MPSGSSKVNPFHANLRIIDAQFRSAGAARGSLAHEDRFAPISQTPHPHLHHDRGAQGLPLTRTAILKTLFASTFYSLFLPGSIAAGGATWLKYIQHGAQAGPALAAIIANRLTEIITVMFAGAAYWAIDRWFHGWSAVLLVGVACASLWAIYSLLLGHVHYPPVLVHHVMRALHLGDTWAHRKSMALASHLARLKDLPAAAVIGVLSAGIVQDLIGTTSFLLLARALDLHLSFVTVGWMHALAYTLTLLPISIAGLGVRETALVLVTAPYGVPAAAALAWSSLVFLGTVIAGLGGGLFEAHALWRWRS